MSDQPAPDHRRRRHAGAHSALVATLLAALSAATLPGCTMTMYERGLVRRVDATKTVRPGPVRARALRLPGGAPALALRSDADVELQRQVVYQTIVAEAGWTPWWEPIELLTSPLYLPITLLLAAFALDDTADRKIPASSRLKVAFAPINPAMSIFGMTLKRTEISDEDHFRDPPKAMRFAMHMPLAEAPVSWQARDAGGAVVAKGDGTTDAFGRLALPPEAAGKKVQVRGQGFEVEIDLP